MKRLFLTAGLLAAFALTGREASAQTGTARGKVLDEKGQPVAEAKVVLDFQGGVSRKYETKTSKKGEFTQVGIYPGVYKVTVTKEGYQGTFTQGRINLGDPTYLPDFKLVTATTAAAAAGGAADKAVADIRGTVERAIELTKAGRYDDAEAAYKEVLAKNPSLSPVVQAQVQHNLAIVYVMKKDTATAEAAYLKAIELRPGYADAYCGLSNLYLAGGQIPKAVELMTRAATEAAEDAKIQNCLGVVYFNTSKYDEAQAAFTKSASLDATNPENQYFLASIAMNKGNAGEAIERLEKYLAASPQDPAHVATAQALLQALKAAKK